MASAFFDTLAKLRTHYDLLPWIEVLKGSALASGAAPGAQAYFSAKPSYGLIFDRMPFVGWGYYTNAGTNGFADLSSRSGTFIWSLGASVNKVDQAKIAVSTDTVVGKYSDEWIQLGAGIDVPALETIAATFTVTSARLQQLTATADLYLGLRGYRLWPKGSVSPVQHTRSELLKMGKKLEPYKFAQTVQVDLTQTTKAQTNTITFDRDFLIHRIRVMPQDPTAFAFASLPNISIEPIGRQPLSSDFAPWEFYDGGPLRTQWALELPYTVPAGEVWNLKALVPWAASTAQSTTLEFVFDGELIQ